MGLLYESCSQELPATDRFGDEQLGCGNLKVPGAGDGHTRLSGGGGFWCLEAAGMQAGEGCVAGEGAEARNAEARGHRRNGRPARGPPG